MNNNINIAEILRDCPKGTKLYSSLFGEVEFQTINNDLMFQIVTKIVNEDCKLESKKAAFTKDGTYFGIPNTECVLFPSSKMRDWNKFFKPGDVLVHWYHGLGVIFKEWIDAYISFKVSICQLKNGGFAKRDEKVFMSEDFSKASDEQRDKFIADMEKFFGGKYNPETLSVEPVNSKSPFRPFDKVLVRDTDEQTWCANYFSHYKNDPNYFYVCINGIYHYCIPYNEHTAHLLGTTDPYTEGGSK